MSTIPLKRHRQLGDVLDGYDQESTYCNIKGIERGCICDMSKKEGMRRAYYRTDDR